MTSQAPNASRMFAQSLGTDHTGPAECYYCGGPCPADLAHREPPPMIGRRGPLSKPARRPGSPYMCHGCQRWQVAKMTVPYMGGGLRERQPPGEAWWWISPTGSWGLSRESSEALYTRLMQPPCEFALILSDGGTSHIQCASSNFNPVVTAATPLWLTLNNQPLQFSVYELYQAARGEVAGLEPGVRALVRLFGAVPASLVPSEETAAGEPKGRGRPSHKEKDPRVGVDRRVLRYSGGREPKATAV